MSTATAEVDPELRAFRELVAQILGGGAQALAHDLTNLLLEISARLGRARRTVDSGSTVAGELGALDDAFGRAVALTRGMGERLSVRHRACDLTSVNHVVCELAAMVGPAMPAGMSFAVTYPHEPCIVATSPCDLRRALAAIVAAMVEGLEGNGEVRVAVLLDRADGRRGQLRLEVVCSSDPALRAAQAWTTGVAMVRDLAEPMGAALTVSSDEGGRVTLALTCALVS